MATLCRTHFLRFLLIIFLLPALFFLSLLLGFFLLAVTNGVALSCGSREMQATHSGTTALPASLLSATRLPPTAQLRTAFRNWVGQAHNTNEPTPLL